MICETCHGRGWFWGDSLPVIGVMPADPARPPVELSLKVPCEDCGGNGHAHCCDGLIAQGERDDRAASACRRSEPSARRRAVD
jgi:hypothetical protein